MPAGELQKCNLTQGGFCSWHIPQALAEVAAAALNALIELRMFMWKQGYSDQTPAMAKADVAIYNATDGKE